MVVVMDLRCRKVGCSDCRIRVEHRDFLERYARYMYRRAELNIKLCEDMSMI